METRHQVQRPEIYCRLILCRSFHKLKNMVKFYKEFIFVIIEGINMQISTFCHFYAQKKEHDVILMYNTALYVIVFCNLKSTSCQTHLSHIMYQNNIKFSFLMTNDTLNNNKYKFLVHSPIINMLTKLGINLSVICNKMLQLNVYKL